MKTLVPDTTPSLPSDMVPSTSSAVTEPSARAMKMTSEELCQWLKEKRIAARYIEYFRENDIDGSVLGACTDDDLKEMGISEPFIRKKIIIQFGNIN